MIQTRQRIVYRSGKLAAIRRTSMSYDRLMQVVAEQAMQCGGRRWSPELPACPHPRSVCEIKLMRQAA